MLMTDRPDDYPRPWRMREHRSGIAIKDAAGMTVLILPFTGKASADAKRRTARLILEAVNSHGRETPAVAVRIGSAGERPSSRSALS